MSNLFSDVEKTSRYSTTRLTCMCTWMPQCQSKLSTKVESASIHFAPPKHSTCLNSNKQERNFSESAHSYHIQYSMWKMAEGLSSFEEAG